MPKLVQQVRVFISSPSELAAERDAAREVINEVNRLLGSSSTVELRCITADDDVVSGIGSDAQSVINGQVPDYDIYVGMMATRFGTPTPRAGSGTEEEYLNAYNRCGAGDQVDIMFFFSSAPVRMDTLDLEQAAKIKSFKQIVSDNGVYYKEFANLDDLKTQLRQGLQYYARRWEQASNDTRPSVPQDERIAVLREIDDDADAGPLDFLAEMEDAQEEAVKVISKVVECNQNLAFDLDQRTAELNTLTNAGGSPSYKRIRKVIDHSADDVHSFAEEMEGALPVFRSTMGVITDRSVRLVNARLSEGDTPVEELQEALLSFQPLANGMEGAYNGLMELRQTIAGTTSPTSTFRKAARRALGAMDDFLSELAGQQVKLKQMLSDLVAEIERKQ